MSVTTDPPNDLDQSADEGGTHSKKQIVKRKWNQIKNVIIKLLKKSTN